MPNERPLSDAERARLAQIRQNTAIRNARNRIELEDEKDFWWKVVGVLVVLLLLCWPLLVWHQPGSSTPTTVGWGHGGFLDRYPSRHHGVPGGGGVRAWERPRW